jgi:hypothetical protein
MNFRSGDVKLAQWPAIYRGGGLVEDRYFAPEIEAAIALLRAGVLVGDHLSGGA